jgi:hypothetical protein
MAFNCEDLRMKRLSVSKKGTPCGSSKVMAHICFRGSLVLASLVGLFGCPASKSSTPSSDSGSPKPKLCDQHPPLGGQPIRYACDAGQTCWPTAAYGATYGATACLASGAGKAGAPCSPVPDEPQCADGLGCLFDIDLQRGVCEPYCDHDSDCPQGSSCETNMCMPPCASIPDLFRCPGDAGTNDA